MYSSTANSALINISVSFPELTVAVQNNYLRGGFFEFDLHSMLRFRMYLHNANIIFDFLMLVVFILFKDRAVK